MAGTDRFERICGRGGDERTLRTRLLEELRSLVPFDAHAWVLTDPETCVGWSPLADGIPLGDLAALIRLKYRTTVNRWTTLPTGAAATLVGTTGGDRMQSPMWAELLARRGVDDVASTVFRDQHGCWGFLDVWRAAGAFDDRERELLGDLTTAATPALRRALQLTFEPAAADLDPRSGPAVVLLTDDLEIVTGTKQVEADLRSLLPTDADRSPVPAAALNAAAQLLAVEAGSDDHPPRARAHLDGSRWVTVAAARTEGSWSTAAEPGLIAVTVEPTTPTERAALFARVVGMTARETDLLHTLVEGCDTREIAGRLHVSEHTVQDHLKSMFAKTGARNRKTVVAWATGGRSSATS